MLPGNAPVTEPGASNTGMTATKTIYMKSCLSSGQNKTLRCVPLESQDSCHQSRPAHQTLCRKCSLELSPSCDLLGTVIAQGLVRLSHVVGNSWAQIKPGFPEYQQHAPSFLQWDVVKVLLSATGPD